jgi:hypothetical protein
MATRDRRRGTGELATLRVAPRWPRVSEGPLGAAWGALGGRRNLLLSLGFAGGVLARLLLP